MRFLRFAMRFRYSNVVCCGVCWIFSAKSISVVRDPKNCRSRPPPSLSLNNAFEIYVWNKFVRSVRLERRLPVVVYKHKSLIWRQLGDVDMTLQNNKAVNLSLAAPKISGVLIQPGETFSLWHLVGKTSAHKGYKEGLMIKRGKPDRGIGGGLCQLSNLIHWIVLHTPFVIIEHHHHNGVDLFPDFGRQVPFGVGTSISYNYLDYRFVNNTEQTFQLFVYTDEKYLNAELRAEKPLPVKYHIESRNERFAQENGIWYRNGEVWRQCIDKSSSKIIEEKLIKTNHAQVMYDEKYIPMKKQK